MSCSSLRVSLPCHWPEVIWPPKTKPWPARPVSSCTSMKNSPRPMRRSCFLLRPGISGSFPALLRLEIVNVRRVLHADADDAAQERTLLAEPFIHGPQRPQVLNEAIQRLAVPHLHRP